jgi:hypothetical protein
VRLARTSLRLRQNPGVGTRTRILWFCTEVSPRTWLKGLQPITVEAAEAVRAARVVLVVVLVGKIIVVKE